MCYNTAVAKSADGTVSLTGQDAHAWVEVYFDGVGWLPVDVTPGYYYDAIALHEMIALPDTVRKTAALVVLGLTRWFLLVRLARGSAVTAALAAQDLDACLGWNAAETDVQIARRFSQAEPGEYTRAVTLMEKFTYGGPMAVSRLNRLSCVCCNRF